MSSAATTHSEVPAPRALPSSNLISYLSSLRRTLPRHPSCGNVTLFAFNQGQGLSEHTAPFDALVQVLDGDAEAMVAGKPIEMKLKDVVILPAGQPYAVKAITRFKMLLTIIRP